mgnify:CR=1 FL=1
MKTKEEIQRYIVETMTEGIQVKTKYQNAKHKSNKKREYLYNKMKKLYIRFNNLIYVYKIRRDMKNIDEIRAELDNIVDYLIAEVKELQQAIKDESKIDEINKRIYIYLY